MPKLTEDTLRERETVILWNETDEPAQLWTASVSVRRDWESLGYQVAEYGGGWMTKVPKDRVVFKIQKRLQKH